MNSIEMLNHRDALRNAMDEAVKAENMEEAHRLEGEIRYLDKTLRTVLTEEADARNAAATNVVSDAPKTFTERIFGAKATFKGIVAGFKASAPITNALSGLGTPQEYKTDLSAPVEAPVGFLDTLPKGTTNGDEHFFKAPVLTNNAAGWTSGNKPESALKWTEGTALLETIAHYIPIKKQTANRYEQLDNIVRGALRTGLRLTADEYALRGDNESGIIGVTETDGILLHTMADGATIVDTIRTMARKVRVASGRAANYVALSPYAIEAIALLKDENGAYLYPQVANGGSIFGLTVVEDVNMTDGDKETALVYYNGGARWDVADPAEVTIGLTNSQFIQNEYTLLAEVTATLAVETPAAFCYCADLGLEAEAIDSE